MQFNQFEIYTGISNLSNSTKNYKFSFAAQSGIEFLILLSNPDIFQFPFSFWSKEKQKTSHTYELGIWNWVLPVYYLLHGFNVNVMKFQNRVLGRKLSSFFESIETIILLIKRTTRIRLQYISLEQIKISGLFVAELKFFRG